MPQRAFKISSFIPLMFDVARAVNDNPAARTSARLAAVPLVICEAGVFAWVAMQWLPLRGRVLDVMTLIMVLWLFAVWAALSTPRPARSLHLAVWAGFYWGKGMVLIPVSVRLGDALAHAWEYPVLVLAAPLALALLFTMLTVGITTCTVTTSTTSIVSRRPSYLQSCLIALRVACGLLYGSGNPTCFLVCLLLGGTGLLLLAIMFGFTLPFHLPALNALRSGVFATGACVFFAALYGLYFEPITVFTAVLLRITALSLGFTITFWHHQRVNELPGEATLREASSPAQAAEVLSRCSFAAASAQAAERGEALFKIALEKWATSAEVRLVYAQYLILLGQTDAATSQLAVAWRLPVGRFDRVSLMHLSATCAHRETTADSDLFNTELQEARKLHRNALAQRSLFWQYAANGERLHLLPLLSAAGERVANEAQSIYLDLLKRFPASPLLYAAYGRFLRGVRNDGYGQLVCLEYANQLSRTGPGDSVLPLPIATQPRISRADALLRASLGQEERDNPSAATLRLDERVSGQGKNMAEAAFLSSPAAHAASGVKGLLLLGGVLLLAHALVAVWSVPVESAVQTIAAVGTSAHESQMAVLHAGRIDWAFQHDDAMLLTSSAAALRGIATGLRASHRAVVRGVTSLMQGKSARGLASRRNESASRGLEETGFEFLRRSLEVSDAADRQIEDVLTDRALAAVRDGGLGPLWTSYIGALPIAVDGLRRSVASMELAGFVLCSVTLLALGAYVYFGVLRPMSKSWHGSSKLIDAVRALPTGVLSSLVDEARTAEAAEAAILDQVPASARSAEEVRSLVELARALRRPMEAEPTSDVEGSASSRWWLVAGVGVIAMLLGLLSLQSVFLAWRWDPVLARSSAASNCTAMVGRVNAMADELIYFSNVGDNSRLLGPLIDFDNSADGLLSRVRDDGGGDVVDSDLEVLEQQLGRLSDALAKMASDTDPNKADLAAVERFSEVVSSSDVLTGYLYEAEDLRAQYRLAQLGGCAAIGCAAICIFALVLRPAMAKMRRAAFAELSLYYVVPPSLLDSSRVHAVETITPANSIRSRPSGTPADKRPGTPVEGPPADLANRTRIQSLLSTSADATVVLNHAGIVVDSNKAAQQLAALPRQDLIGRKFGTLVIGDYAPSELLTTDATGRSWSCTLIRDDGFRLPCRMALEERMHAADSDDAIIVSLRVGHSNSPTLHPADALAEARHSTNGHHSSGGLVGMGSVNMGEVGMGPRPLSTGREREAWEQQDARDRDDADQLMTQSGRYESIGSRVTRATTPSDGETNCFFNWETASGNMWFSDDFKTHLGYDPADEIAIGMAHIDTFRRLVHPNDLATFDAKMNNFILNASGSAMVLDVRLRNQTGRYFWSRIRAKIAQRDAGGFPIVAFKLVLHVDDLPVETSGAPSPSGESRAQSVATASNGTNVSLPSLGPGSLGVELVEANRSGALSSKGGSRALEDFASPVSSDALRKSIARGVSSTPTESSSVGSVLGRLMNDNLDMSSSMLREKLNRAVNVPKIEAGNVRFSTQDIDIHNFMAHVTSMISAECLKRGVEVAVLISQDVPSFIRADSNVLLQVLVNICENARARTVKGHILILVDLKVDIAMGDDPQLRVRVLDSGPDLSPEETQQAFEPDTSGLAIAQQLILSLGGKMGIETGKGTTLWFTMPLRLPAQIRQDTIHNPDKVQPVLVFHSDTCVHTEIANCLQTYGLKVAFATTRAQVKFKITDFAQRAENIKVLIFDEGNTGVNLTFVRDHVLTESPNLKVIALVSPDRLRDGPQATEVAHAVITKPFTMAKAIEALHSISMPAHQRTNKAAETDLLNTRPSNSYSSDEVASTASSFDAKFKEVSRLLGGVGYRPGSPTSQPAPAAPGPAPIAAGPAPLATAASRLAPSTASISPDSSPSSSAGGLYTSHNAASVSSATPTHSPATAKRPPMVPVLPASPAVPPMIHHAQSAPNNIQTSPAPVTPRRVISSSSLDAGVALVSPDGTVAGKLPVRPAMTSPGGTPARSKPPSPAPKVPAPPLRPPPVKNVAAAMMVDADSDSCITNQEEADSKPMVLLVEDNHVNQMILKTMIEQENFRVDVASNGLEALQKIQPNIAQYGLVLMDIQMPEMDGYTCIAAIRQMELGTLNHLPLIAYTAHTTAFNTEKCKSIGTDDFLFKPVTQEALTKCLRKWVRTAPPASSFKRLSMRSSAGASSAGAESSSSEGRGPSDAVFSDSMMSGGTSSARTPRDRTPRDAPAGGFPSPTPLRDVDFPPAAGSGSPRHSPSGAGSGFPPGATAATPPRPPPSVVRPGEESSSGGASIAVRQSLPLGTRIPAFASAVPSRNTHSDPGSAASPAPSTGAVSPGARVSMSASGRTPPKAAPSAAAKVMPVPPASPPRVTRFESGSEAGSASPTARPVEPAVVVQPPTTPRGGNHVGGLNTSTPLVLHTPAPAAALVAAPPEAPAARSTGPVAAAAEGSPPKSVSAPAVAPVAAPAPAAPVAAAGPVANGKGGAAANHAAPSTGLALSLPRTGPGPELEGSSNNMLLGAMVNGMMVPRVAVQEAERPRGPAIAPRNLIVDQTPAAARPRADSESSSSSSINDSMAMLSQDDYDVPAPAPASPALEHLSASKRVTDSQHRLAAALRFLDQEQNSPRGFANRKAAVAAAAPVQRAPPTPRAGTGFNRDIQKVADRLNST